MGSSRNSHMLTYQTTRKVKCLYFDGESATLFGTGQMHTQMLHIWGNITGPGRPPNGGRGLWEEYARAAGLCDWIKDQELGGSGWGYEGIVRMNAGFEMIWCNFSSSSIRLVSHLNITAPLLPEGGENYRIEETEASPTSYYPLPPSSTRSDKATDPANPPRPPMGGSPAWQLEPFFRSQAWAWYSSATQHYGSNGDGPGRGETHVKPTTCGFLSYYSPEFQSQSIPRSKEEQKLLNLTGDGTWAGPGKDASRIGALQALTRRRRSHTLEHISPSDAAIMRSNSERVLRDLLLPSPKHCSGIDWSIMTNDIVQSYAGSLYRFLSTLERYENSSRIQTLLRKWMIDVRDDTHAFIMPFLQYPDQDKEKDVWSRNSALFKTTYSRCKYQHTRLLDPEQGITLGPEEKLLQWAVEDTLSGICSVLVDVGFSVEGIWESDFNIPSNSTLESQFFHKLDMEVARWTEGIEELMAWLGWAGEWTRCEKRCAWDESCFIPMWPMIPFRGRGGGRGPPRYGYGRRPGYGGPNPHDGRAGNGTGGPPKGFNPWQPSEEELWSPKCVKSDYLLRGQ